ncbi:hypothetical protein HYH03_001785 [Edaphochlamys debaryana]|uniref:tRNA/rRNA methyltransferase SpoU type domain-containing protein n=1 Tax=Edaphochlamys debaryana TaxID=47281 RepID=A0A835YC38_9CHLO|nr:hypothetical protein HYH03_001785 [Edaphochlamys debaryana]|eukprot:KAG2500207.1 hypothetical protein HYH03_001785 [Edaphochlamys debaryana]
MPFARPRLAESGAADYTSAVACGSDPRSRTKWYGAYTEEQYTAQRQSEERAAWAASVRQVTGNRSQTQWDGSQLDPPALLSGVCVVIISPRKPVTVGTVARACGSFECEDLRIVMPRQQSYITRHAKSASKGAQYILYRAGHYDSIEQATADCDVRVAFTRWAQSSSPQVYKVDINGLASHPAVAAVVSQPLLRSPPPPPPPSAAWTEAAAAAAEAAESSLASPSPSPSSASSTSSRVSGSGSGSDAADSDEGEHRGSSSPRAASQSSPSTSDSTLHTAPLGASLGSNPSAAASHAGPAAAAADDGARASGAAGAGAPSSGGAQRRFPRVALIFGREELGMSDAEVDACEVVCSVPIGRLQESLSLSHAVSIALCGLYQARLQHLASASGSASGAAGAAGAGAGGVEAAGGAAGAGSGAEGLGGSFVVDASTGMVRVLG